MVELADFFHYGTIALAAGVTSVGVGLGEGRASTAAIDAINIQPSAQDDIGKAMIFGSALVETAAIMGTVIAIFLLFTSYTPGNIYTGIAELGIAFAICIPGFFVGYLSAEPTRAACYAIARQPFFSQKIFRFMLISQTIIQTPIIFGFIIAWFFIKNNSANLTSYCQALSLMASGLCLGIGSIGPSLGIASFAATACKGLGINRNAYNQLFSFTIISEAIIETPIFFAVITSALVAIRATTISSELECVALIGAALCMGLGTFGPGISSGNTARAAAEQITLNPEQTPIISRTCLIAQGLIETIAIYCFLISMLLIFWGAPVSNAPAINL